MALSMAIPIYRHNQVYDDWEVASVYDSDDCESLGRSACDESLHSSASVDDPALYMHGHLYEDGRPQVRYSVPENYMSMAYTRPQRDMRTAPRKQNDFIVPPPGVIFPSQDWSVSSQDAYRSCAPSQIAPSPMHLGLAEPPPSSLLLSPSSPSRGSSPLIRLPSPTTIAHGQLPNATSVITSGTVTKVGTHASAMMQHPSRYHKMAHMAHTIPPRLAEAGCQAHSDMGMNPPRNDMLSSSYAPVRASMLRGPQSSEEMTVVDGRYGPLSHCGPGDRPEPLPLPSKHEYDAIGRTRITRPGPRERRPSIWRRFVRRFSPSQVSVGQT